MSLGEVKRDIDLWWEPRQAERQALEELGNIREVKVNQLPSEPGYNMMTVAFAKTISTIKPE